MTRFEKKCGVRSAECAPRATHSQTHFAPRATHLITLHAPLLFVPWFAAVGLAFLWLGACLLGSDLQEIRLLAYGVLSGAAFWGLLVGWCLLLWRANLADRRAEEKRARLRARLYGARN